MHSRKKTHSGDVANRYIRNILCELSEKFGGFGLTEQKKTLKKFNNCCAYTNLKLKKKDLVWDHLIPQNREKGGLHIYGNLVPTSKIINGKKGSKNFKDFINNNEIFVEWTNEQREDKIKELQSFLDENVNNEMSKNPILQARLNEKYIEIQEKLKIDFDIICNLILLDEQTLENVNNITTSLTYRDEIEKVKKRIPKWFRNSSQTNSTILLTFLKNANNGFIDRFEFSKMFEAKSFNTNFPQMLNFGKKNHAKVFEIIDDKVFLWAEVKDYILNEYLIFKK